MPHREQISAAPSPPIMPILEVEEFELEEFPVEEQEDQEEECDQPEHGGPLDEEPLLKAAAREAAKRNWNTALEFAMDYVFQVSGAVSVRAAHC